MLPGAELLAVLQWLDVVSLAAAERVCRRWYAIARSPAAWHAHRPRSRVWVGLEPRAAAIAEHVAERGWLAGRSRITAHRVVPNVDSVQLDGPRMAMFGAHAVEVMDARTFALQRRLAAPPGVHLFWQQALVDGRMAVLGGRGTVADVLYVDGADDVLCDTGARVPFECEYVGWRGAHIACASVIDWRDHVVSRVDAASGRVTRSLLLWREPHAATGWYRLAFGLADGIGVGLVTREGLHVDDGRADHAMRLPMRHSERCPASDWEAYAHPDGRTLATFCFDRAGDEYGTAPGLVQLWDTRALEHARATFELPVRDEFLCFGRRTVRTASDKGIVAHHDLDTGTMLGAHALHDHQRGRHLRAECANEAFAVCIAGGVSYTVHAFGDAVA